MDTNGRLVGKVFKQAVRAVGVVVACVWVCVVVGRGNNEKKEG